MQLFQKSVINKYLKEQDEIKIKSAYEKLKLYQNQAEEIKGLKEEKYQDGFFREVFVDVFGYSYEAIDKKHFNLVREQKNVSDSKKADGAIFRDGKVRCVIELKDTSTTDLSKVEDQAFKYLTGHANCDYVVISNFAKLNFYIKNRIDKISVDLFTISFDDFQPLFMCLHADNLLSDLPLKLKKETVTSDKKVSEGLYRDYSKLRSELLNDLIKNNPQHDELLLFNKTQKLLDRFLFIFFAEDRGLLPSNAISEILDKWKDDINYGDERSLYSVFKIYFNAIDKGRSEKCNRQEIYAYNGGLFAQDEVLDSLIIDSNLLYQHSKKLTGYDFESEVSVNILGHIFENSLSDIEEIQHKLQGIPFNIKEGRRKKDGVFYTPQYITQFIVQNTVGKLCDSKKIEFGISEIDLSKNYILKKSRIVKSTTEFTNLKGETIQTEQRKKTTLSIEGESVLKSIEQYKKWLLSITICDPACGSGAFLNQALEFLISEHKLISEMISKIKDSNPVLENISNSILENNLFGVDINSEAIEIAKLALWLRTAQHGRKLFNLSKNIKCGNSLISDIDVAGDKAFDWEKEFPEVFKKGGFDIVIGNPPYVRQELFKEIKPYLEHNYSCYNSIADLYTYFVEKGISLTSKHGYFSFILPNKFMRAKYGAEIRDVILKESSIDLIYDFDDYPVFDDATTYPIIFVLSMDTKDKFYYSEINKRSNTLDPISLLESNKIEVLNSSLSKESWNFNDARTFSILEKLRNNTIELKEFVNNQIYRGVSTGCNEVFILDQKTIEPFKDSPLIQKIFTGKEVKRYKADFKNLYLLFLTWDYDINTDESIKSYLHLHQDKLTARPEVKEGRFNWWCLSRYGSKNSHLLSKPKIIYPRINNDCNFFLDSSGEYSLSDNNFFISTDRKDILALLNSKLIFFYLKNHCSTLQGGYYDFRRPYIEKIPITNLLLNENHELINLSDKATELYSDLNSKLNTFVSLLKSKFSLDRITKKAENWHELEFNDFITELNKIRKKAAKENKIDFLKLTLSQESEWMQYFNNEKQKVHQIQIQIIEVNKTINQIVYGMYGLTHEEIEIITNS